MTLQAVVEAFEGPRDLTELRSLGDSLDLVMISSRPRIRAEIPPVLREIFPKAFVVDMVDFQDLREARRARLEGQHKSWAGPIGRSSLGSFGPDATIAVTESEREVILLDEPDAEIIPTIHDAPWSASAFVDRRDRSFTDIRDGERPFVAALRSGSVLLF